MPSKLLPSTSLGMIGNLDLQVMKLPRSYLSPSLKLTLMPSSSSFSTAASDKLASCTVYLPAMLSSRSRLGNAIVPRIVTDSLLTIVVFLKSYPISRASLVPIYIVTGVGVGVNGFQPMSHLFGTRHREGIACRTDDQPPVWHSERLHRRARRTPRVLRLGTHREPVRLACKGSYSY